MASEAVSVFHLAVLVKFARYSPARRERFGGKQAFCWSACHPRDAIPSQVTSKSEGATPDGSKALPSRTLEDHRGVAPFSYGHSANHRSGSHADQQGDPCAAREAACRNTSSFCAEAQSEQRARSFPEASSPDRSIDQRVWIQQSGSDRWRRPNHCRSWSGASSQASGHRKDPYHTHRAPQRVADACLCYSG